MEGSRAFQTLEEILDTWKENELINKLTEVKRYLKTDFKVKILLLSLKYLTRLVEYMSKFC